MKITIDSIEMAAVGCVPRFDGRITITFHSNDSFIELVKKFDGVKALTAERPAGKVTWAGEGKLVSLCRNLGSDFVNITLAGLIETPKEG